MYGAAMLLPGSGPWNLCCVRSPAGAGAPCSPPSVFLSYSDGSGGGRLNMMGSIHPKPVTAPDLVCQNLDSGSHQPRLASQAPGGAAPGGWEGGTLRYSKTRLLSLVL